MTPRTFEFFLSDLGIPSSIVQVIACAASNGQPDDGKSSSRHDGWPGFEMVLEGRMSRTESLNG